MKKHFLTLALCLATAFAVSATEGKGRDYRFDGKISREVLENYLSRSISMGVMGEAMLAENVPMLTDIGAKFIGRAIGLWGGETRLNDPSWLPEATKLFARMHKLDPDMVIQCCMFEIVTDKVNEVAIPAWVFEEFGQKPEKRNFRFDDMLLSYGRHSDRNYWDKNQAVPNIVKLETQMWFYFLAASYINTGVEAIHFGQVGLMSSNDTTNFSNFFDVMGRIRKYASKNARRHFVIIDAHTHGIADSEGRLLYDFHSMPIRPKETPDKPQGAVLEMGYLDTLFGRSKGGTSPSGWVCESLPYLVEVDNYSKGQNPGQPGEEYFPWGWDEISWYASQPENFRNQWIEYAWKWVRENDKNGFLEMTGSRPAHHTALDTRVYRANTKSAEFPLGFSQQETIKRIWAEDDRAAGYTK